MFSTFKDCFTDVKYFVLKKIMTLNREFDIKIKRHKMELLDK